MSAKIQNAILDEVQSLAVNPVEPIHPGSPLLDGTLDSLALTNLMQFLQDEYLITVDPKDLTQENFGTVSALSGYVVSRQTSSSRHDGKATCYSPDSHLRILIVHRDAMFPPVHGGAKCMRAIAEMMATRGHSTTVRFQLSSSASNNDSFAQDPNLLPVDVGSSVESGCEFSYEAVDYIAGSPESSFTRSIGSSIRSISPDLVLLTEDALSNGAQMLDAVLEQSNAPVALFVWTLAGLPFGPAASALDERIAGRLERVNMLIAPGDYAASYIMRWSGREARTLRLPVFGNGPFTNARRRRRAGSFCQSLQREGIAYCTWTNPAIYEFDFPGCAQLGDYCK